jgi:hypothetical protein
VAEHRFDRTDEEGITVATLHISTVGWKECRMYRFGFNRIYTESVTAKGQLR